MKPIVAYIIAVLLVGGAVFALFRFIFSYSLSDSLSFGITAIITPVVIDTIKWYRNRQKAA